MDQGGKLPLAAAAAAAVAAAAGARAAPATPAVPAPIVPANSLMAPTAGMRIVGSSSDAAAASASATGGAAGPAGAVVSGGGLTVEAIQRDRLTQIAAAVWLRPSAAAADDAAAAFAAAAQASGAPSADAAATAAAGAAGDKDKANAAAAVAAAAAAPAGKAASFSPALVREIYNTELLVRTSKGKSGWRKNRRGKRGDSGGGRCKPVVLHRVMVLEVSQYLERYLWPHFDADTSSFEHVMSIILMVNEKFREGVPAWACFSSRPPSVFNDLIKRVLSLKMDVGQTSAAVKAKAAAAAAVAVEGASQADGLPAAVSWTPPRELYTEEKINYVVFVINVFQSLENPLVRGSVLPLVSLPLWHCLSPSRLQRELQSHPQLLPLWERQLKREEKAMAAATTAAAATVAAAAGAEAGEGEDKGVRKTAGAGGRGGRVSAAAVRPSRRVEVRFFLLLLSEFLQVLSEAVVLRPTTNSIDDGGGDDDDIEEVMDGDDEGGEGGAGEEEEGGGTAGVSTGTGEDADVDDARVLYCERFLELLIDLLSQLPTRRFLRPLVDDMGIAIHCQRSALHAHATRGRLFRQLLDLLRFYLAFPLAEQAGRQLSDDEVTQAHGQRISALQLYLFKHVAQLRDVALSSVSSLEKEAQLRKWMARLSDEDLTQLVVRKLGLVSAKTLPYCFAPEQGGGGEQQQQRTRAFAEDAVVAFFQRQRSQRDSINALPLYPTEEVMWNESVVPSVNYTGEGCLALPKLNLQFLTLHDYLLRNFHLFRLESTYEIREDVHDALKRLNARVGYHGRTEFAGWARMAAPIEAFKIVEIAPPKLGEVKPGAVTADIHLSIAQYKGPMREEWDDLKEHDVLFLLSIHPDELLSGPASSSASNLGAKGKGGGAVGEEGEGEGELSGIPAKYGLRRVRGCEVVEVRDENGVLMNDFTGRIKREDWKPPVGNKRTLRVALDPAQFQIDVESVGGDMVQVLGSSSSSGGGAAEGDAAAASNGGAGMDDGSMYGSFNIVLRRKPKENNFKAILESIRDIMNEDRAAAPPWLQDLFLGYDDPNAARMPASLEPYRLRTIDFKDTFLDAGHLRECFPEYKVEFLTPDGVADEDPKPPFRVTLPQPPPPSSSGAVEGAGGGGKDGDQQKKKKRKKGKKEGEGGQGKKKEAAEGEKAADVEMADQAKQKDKKEEEERKKEDMMRDANTLEGKEAEEKEKNKETLLVECYSPPPPGPYPPERVRRNRVRFTGTQVEAIMAGVEPGLTMVVGPPGTGKTDTAVQLLQLLFRNCPDQRTLVITHSNQALNDIFEKIMQRDVPARYLLRLGMGEQELDTEQQFSRQGRVNDMLARRLHLLGQVERLAETLNVPSTVAHTCESAAYFWLLHVLARWEAFVAACEEEGEQQQQPGGGEVSAAAAAAAAASGAGGESNAATPGDSGAAGATAGAAAASPSSPSSAPAGREGGQGESGTGGEDGDSAATASKPPLASPAPGSGSAATEATAAAVGGGRNPGIVKERFPFAEFFRDAPGFKMTGRSYAEDMIVAESCFRYLEEMFSELEECRAFELFKTTADRSNYLMARQAKIVAMTCTHAALKRRDFVNLGFKYDNLLMEESAQILEIETFIPMLLQRQEDGHSRLKRVVLIGDHHQLPPVVQNLAFQKFSHLDQSLFTRFVRLGVPYIELNAQGRARPSIARLYNWRYRSLGDLPAVRGKMGDNGVWDEYARANAGMAFDYQLIDVGDWQGKGESEPSPYFYQNLGEAEFIVSVFQYLRLLGYPAAKISILSTYNGQKHLIRDVIERRCARDPLFGRPSKVTTVDKFQGQQNDIILLSLVRTRTVGHLRDVRRLVVATSRARLGLYIFARASLFANCYELQPAFQQLLRRPQQLALVLSETRWPTRRLLSDPLPLPAPYGPAAPAAAAGGRSAAAGPMEVEAPPGVIVPMTATAPGAVHMPHLHMPHQPIPHQQMPGPFLRHPHPPHQQMVPQSFLLHPQPHQQSPWIPLGPVPPSPVHLVHGGLEEMARIVEWRYRSVMQQQQQQQQQQQ